ncbi:MAG: hypothetical protein ACI4XJ_07685, partial [Eubacteriales bacterium]
IGVIYKGNIVEIAPSEELFNYPLHPYTRSLISAIPIPDPALEKNKVLFTYDPSMHDYSEDKPEMVCIGHDHYVYGNKKEIEEYKSVRDKNEIIKSITIRDPNAPDEHNTQDDVVSREEILETPLHDTGSIWYSIGSFLLPVFGLIAAGIFKHHKYYRNFKACRKGALIGLGILGAIIILFLIFLLMSII